MQALNTLRVYTNVPQLYTSSLKRGSKIDMYVSRNIPGDIPGNAGADLDRDRSPQPDAAGRNRRGQSQRRVAAGIAGAGALQGVDMCSHFIIPVSAIIFRREGTQVGTLGADNDAHLIQVTMGRDDGATVQIVSGLKDADRCTHQDPPDSLIEGEKVSPGESRQPERRAAGGRGANSDGFGCRARECGSLQVQSCARRALNWRLWSRVWLGLASFGS